MNGTELKTLRQSLFLSVAEAARLHGVQERVYRYWEAGEWAVPDDVAARMEALDDAADTIADNIAGKCKHRADTSRPPVLFRFSCDEDLHAMTTRTIFNEYLHGIPASVYAAGIDRARQDIRRDGERARIVIMDNDAYQEWLTARGAQDSGRNRQDWAATVTDPPTRAKKIKQASGEQNQQQASGEGEADPMRSSASLSSAIKISEQETRALANTGSFQKFQVAARKLWNERVPVGAHPSAIFEAKFQEGWDSWYLCMKLTGEDHDR